MAGFRKFICAGDLVIGTIFNIQGYATHDGPGIRTTVFLKGCPLACFWCHNPEGRSPHPEVSVNPELCIGCRTCVTVCPDGAAIFESGGPSTDRERCTTSGYCVDACPSGARTMLGRSYTVTALVDVIDRDRIFYDASGGGVTFSGGEPLLQSEFLIACMEECARRGIHTAVDTSGVAAPETVRRVAMVADLILYDLKVMDDSLHRQATGVSNASVLSNLRMLAESGSDVRLRFPLIPGFNDTPTNISSTVDFVRTLPLRYPIHVLPYHRIGRHKYARLGTRDTPEDIPEASADHIVEVVETFRAMGLEAVIGG